MTAPGRRVTATSATTRDVPLMASRCQWRCFAIAPGDGNDPAALTGDCPCMRAEANALVAIWPQLLVPGATATQVVMAAGALLDLHPDDQPARVALAAAELRLLVGQEAAA